MLLTPALTARSTHHNCIHPLPGGRVRLAPASATDRYAYGLGPCSLRLTIGSQYSIRSPPTSSVRAARVFLAQTVRSNPPGLYANRRIGSAPLVPDSDVRRWIAQPADREPARRLGRQGTPDREFAVRIDADGGMKSWARRAVLAAAADRAHHHARSLPVESRKDGTRAGGSDVGVAREPARTRLHAAAGA